MDTYQELKTIAKRSGVNMGLRYLNDYATAVICHVFQTTGLREWLQTPVSFQQLVAAAGLDPEKAQKPLAFMCQWLVSDGILTRSHVEGTDVYSVVPEATWPTLEQYEGHLVAKAFPAGPRLLRMAADHAGAVLHGKDPSNDLYAPDTVSTWEGYFNHPGMQLPAQITARFVYEQIARRERPIRVLEVGAGSASATRALYDLLRSKHELERIDQFTVTDVTEGFIGGAKQILTNLYGEQDVFTYHLLDLNQPFAEQGFLPDSYDVIVGVNCLHYVRDWDQQFAALRSLLKPGGALICAGFQRNTVDKPFHIELLGCLFEEYYDVITIPDIRPGFGIMPAENMAAAFKRAGFPRTSIWPDLHFWRDDTPLDFYCGVIAGTIEA